MIKKYNEFINDDIQLNESEEKMVNEAAKVIAASIKNKKFLHLLIFIFDHFVWGPQSKPSHGCLPWGERSVRRVSIERQSRES